MILQKIAHAIRRQDWFQVTVEILIVIVGIFLGLQVQEWNEARQDREAGERYLAQIIEDLKYDLVTTNSMLEEAVPLKQRQLFRIEQMIESGELMESSEVNLPFSANLPEGPRVQIEIDSFKSLEFSTIFSWSYPAIRTTTYDDLQNSGKLALIADDNIRFLISDYYDQSRNANNRVIQRITGYGAALYKLVGGGARTAFTHTSSGDYLRFDQSGFDANVSIEEFIVRAENEEFKSLLRAEINYTAFLFDMA